MAEIPSYTGHRAENYDDRRSNQEQWKREHAAVKKLFNHFYEASGSTLFPDLRVLDCPVGTGRFRSIYDRLGVDYQGLDISEDMLAQAQAKGWPEDKLTQGSAFQLPYGFDSFHLGVCIRFLNWFGWEDTAKIMTQLSTVCRELIVGVATAPKAQPLPEAHSIHSFHQWDDLLKELGLQEKEYIYIVPKYRIVHLEPK